MTLVVTVASPETIWVLADRRLSYPGGKYKDDARKLAFIDTMDGTAILSYAGLGATASGMEPSLWMSNVLRGINAPMEQCLAVLANAMKQNFPPHLSRMHHPVARSHSMVIPSFVNEKPILYSIDIAFSEDRKNYDFRYTRHIQVVGASGPIRPVTPKLRVAGSGGAFLANSMGKQWIRPLLRNVRAHDRGQLSAHTVADRLAALNMMVYNTIPQKTVGPKCIVAWRYRNPDNRKEGQAQQYYDGLTRDASGPALPAISRGQDINAVIGALLPDFFEFQQLMLDGKPIKEFDVEAANARLAALPDAPDDRLR